MYGYNPCGGGYGGYGGGYGRGREYNGGSTFVLIVVLFSFYSLLSAVALYKKRGIANE